MATRDQLVQCVLGLSREDRAYLLDLLWRSLECDDREVELEFGELWTAEIDRRITAYEAGETKAVDAETAMKETRDKLKEMKQRG